MNPSYKSLLALSILHSWATQHPWAFSILTWQWGGATWGTNTRAQLYDPAHAYARLGVWLLFPHNTHLVRWAWTHSAHCHTSRCVPAVWPKFTFIMEDSVGHAGNRNDTNPGATGYDAQMTPIGARSCVNLVHPPLNDFNFSSSGWNFASFYRGHFKSFGGKISLQIKKIIFGLKNVFNEWALIMGYWVAFFSWMVLKFFHGLGSKMCCLLRHFINMK